MKVPTRAFVVSKAEPVRVGLVTVTELAPLPVNVMLWLLGPKVIWAAPTPEPHKSGLIANAIAVKSLVRTRFTPKKCLPAYKTDTSNCHANLIR